MYSDQNTHVVSVDARRIVEALEHIYVADRLLTELLNQKESIRRRVYDSAGI